MASSDQPQTTEVGHPEVGHPELGHPEVDPTSRLIADFAGTAQALFVAGGVEMTLQAVVDLAVSTIDSCDFAGILVLQDGHVTTSVNTSPVVSDVDALQLSAGHGPCFDAIASDALCYGEDLATDARWPEFGPAAAATGVRSALALRLLANGTFGSLNLYAAYPLAFGAVDRAKGLVLSGLAGLALLLAKTHEQEARLADNLRKALATRELVGQAQGILMEREHITAEQAFDILRRASQHLNLKLREVAQDLVDTGERPSTGHEPLERLGKSGEPPTRMA
jgi:hypothetical protein